MSKTQSANVVAERVRRALEGLIAKDVSPWVTMFAEDGAMEFPFALPGYPRRVEGKSAIAEHMKRFPDHLEIFRIVWFKPYTIVGGNGVVIEFACEGRALATGRPYNQTYVSVIEHEGGLVKLYRDYWNPLVALEAMGGAEGLLAFGQKGR